MGYSKITQLNKEQKEAAESIYGARLVLAGAGTGKTQVLAARIANMLASDVMINPSMILALTFTEAGVVAMRKRLVEVIGVEAYKIAIHTFHSFCNEVIQVNPSYFGIKDFEPVSELEQMEVMYEIIDELPAGNVLKRLLGDPYYEVTRMLRFNQTFKEENYSISGVKLASKQYLDSLPEREEYIYKRGNKKKGIQVGDIKTALIGKEAEKLDLVIAAAEQVGKYNKKLWERNRYDFSDMIHWVLKAFKNDEYFLLNYQEHYQFILIDEFQDTNGSQLELINVLMSFWVDPNIFVVGDDDQSVYEFNGARIKNIIDFKEQYNSEVTVLTKNYRSNQLILDAAGAVITNNEQRLINNLQGLSKDLIAASNKGKQAPTVYSFANPAQEAEGVIKTINELIKHPDNKPSDIAIIYRKHRQSEPLLQQLQVMGIPYNIKKRIDVLDTVVVRQMLEIIEYIVSYKSVHPEAVENKLFNILHFRFWGNDIAKIHKYYITRLDKHNKTRKPKDIIRTHRVLSGLIDDYNNNSLINNVFEIINVTGIKEWVLQLEDSVEVLNYISTFFSWVKSEAYKNPALDGNGLLTMIGQMQANNIRLSVDNLHSVDDGVNLMTVHGSKGLEFKYVIMIGCNRSEWEKSRAGSMSYKLPDTLTFSGGEDKLEANRRLFYVGMTRAKNELTITFPASRMDGKDLEPTQFITETGLWVEQYPALTLKSYLLNAITKPVFDMEMVNKDIITARLDGLKLSISAVSKYLRCHLSYYYENVLRVPFVAKPALIYGNACHFALKSLYDAAKANEPLNWDAFFKVFVDFMTRNLVQVGESEYNRRIELGEKELKAYFLKTYPYSNKITVNEFHIARVVLGGVPFTGDIDKGEFTGRMVDVVDYKTGNYANAVKKIHPPTPKDPIGGDYWRQMVAYKLMVDNLQGRDWGFRGGRLMVISKNGGVPVPIEVTHEDEKVVMAQIKQAYDGIMNHEFSDGCGDPNCVWCNFQKQLNTNK